MHSIADSQSPHAGIAHDAHARLSQKSQKRTLAIATLAFIFLGVLTPLQLYAGEHRGVSSIEFWLCLLVLEVCALRIAFLATQYPRYLTLTFYFFIYIWIGWAGAYQIYLWQFTWPVVHTPEHMRKVVLLVLLAIACYEIGGFFGGRKARPLTAAGYGTTRMTSFNRMLLLAGLSLFGLALGVAVLGVDGVLGTRAKFQAGALVDSTSLIMTTFAMRTPCFVLLIVTLQVLQTRWRQLNQPRKRLLLALMLLALAVTAVADYPPSLPRYWMGPVVFTILMVLTPWSRFSASAWIIFLVLGLTWVYPRADAFRRAPTVAVGWDRLINNEGVQDQMLSSDYDVLQMSANAIVYTEHQGLNWGSNFLVAGLFYVPRSIWSNKPQRSDLVISNGLGYQQKNLSVPLWAEAYLALATGGVAVVFLIYGYWSRVADMLYNKGRSLYGNAMTGTASLLVPFLASFQFTFMRGNLMNGVAYSFVAIALIVAMHTGNKKKQPDAASPLARTA